MFLKNLVCMVVLLICAVHSSAAMLKAHVAEFKVTGSPDKDGLKTALQSMLASRLQSENLTVVRGDENPDVTVISTYIVFGKIFSLDGQIVAANGKILGRAFEQGESADEVIPAVGRLAEKLNKEIARCTAPTAEARTTPSVVLKGEVAAPAKPAALASADIIKTEPMVIAKNEADIVRPEGGSKAEKSGLSLQRLDGILIAVAKLRQAESDKRRVIAATEKELRLYEAGTVVQLLAAEKGFGGNEKIVGLDSADLDNNGSEELYVTSFRGDGLSSRVYEIEQGRFRLIAENLPYFFRAIALDGGDKKIYVQQQSSLEDFYGDMYELTKKGAVFATTNPLKLPKFTNLYGVNTFSVQGGGKYLVSLNSDRYLTVTSGTGEILWKSSDKFGGTEAYFSRDDGQNIQFTGSSSRKVFLEQRITVTGDGTVIVPKNEGTFVVGNSRTFTKSSVYALRWNGIALEEVWHTKQSQNYLADYSYDEGGKELLLLEVVKKAGILEKGASALFIKKVE